MNGSNYQILKVIEILNDLDIDFEKNLIRIDDFTLAKVFKGISGSFYIVPAVGSLGIMGSANVIDSILESKHIPLENKNASNFEKLGLQTPIFFDNFQTKVKTFLEENKIDIIELEQQRFGKLDSLINLSSGNNRFHKYMLDYGLIIAHLIIYNSKENFIWIFKKQYGYNPYYIPKLKVGNNEIDLWYYINRMLLKKTKINTKNVLALFN